MASEFYKIYNEILSKSLKKELTAENNTTGSMGVGPQGDYAPGDARIPKNVFKHAMRRPLIKGIVKPKEVK